MQSYGELLKQAREEKGLDYETVSYDITISVPYLKGLEEEDNSAFPGEPYMLGFLRSYSEYLGLNADAICNLFRAKKLQESPTPEALLSHEKPKYFWPLITSSIFVVIAGVTVFLILFFVKKNATKNADVVLDNGSSTKKYELSDTTFSNRVYKGDQFIYHAQNGDIILTVNETLGALGIQCPVGVLYTELAEEAELDIDGDAKTDLIVYVSDISYSDEKRGAEVRIIRRTGLNYAEAAITEDIPLASEVQGSTKTVLFEDNRAYPFTLNGSFRGSCIFRYKIDRRDSVESYLTSGEIVTVTANNGIRLWMSNSNAVKLTIVADAKTYDIEIGKAGVVLAEDIKWIKDSDGKFKLVVIKLD